MKRFVFALLVLTISAVTISTGSTAAFAQRPVLIPAKPNESPKNDVKIDNQVEVSPGMVAPTAEMWFYEQELRRHDDPHQAVRRNAEFELAQRQERMASRRWFGFSNIRPTADPVPFMGDYSPGWRSNTYMPYQWAGVGGWY